MNEERRHDFHMELWNWLAENPTQEKPDWPGWDCEEVKRALLQSEHLNVHHCFACMVRDELIEQYECGDVCPILWNRSGRHNYFFTPCVDGELEDSMYSEWDILSWVDKRPLEKRQTLAIQIAEAWGTNTGVVA